jgi:hypothetical protein
MNRRIVLVSLFALIIMDQAHESSSLQAMQLQDQGKKLSVITNKSLTKIYKWESPLLSIPKEELIDSSGELVNLKELFEKHQIVDEANVFMQHDEPKPWDDKDWLKAGSVVMKRAQGNEGIPCSFLKKVHLTELPELLRDAKTVLKSFLPVSELPHFDRQFIKKGGQLGRLFTYAKLQRVIEEKKLSHIHLPLKILVIEDKKTGQCVESQKASQLLDDMIKIFVLPSKIETRMHCYSSDYKVHIYAVRQVRHKVPLSQEAQDELKELVAEAPFDVGYDNIFSDANGDAVIIDTEFKGEPADSSVAKLGRYF